MFIAGHEVVQGFCLHCGAREDAIVMSVSVEDGAQLSCKATGKAEGPRPEPALRTYAVDDADVIHQRIAELAQEREAAVARPSEWVAFEEAAAGLAELIPSPIKWPPPVAGSVTSSVLFIDDDGGYLKW